MFSPDKGNLCPMVLSFLQGHDSIGGACKNNNNFKYIVKIYIVNILADPANIVLPKSVFNKKKISFYKAI